MVSLGLCTLADRIPYDAERWWMEPKLDGVRMIADSRRGSVAYTSRNEKDYSHAFPVITESLRRLDATLDGEVVWFDPATGEVDFHKGSGIVRSKDAVARQQRDGWATYMVFDLLRLGNRDLRAWRIEIEERRRTLVELVEALACPLIQVVPQAETSPSQYRDYVIQFREGAVLKRKRSLYPVKRSPSWLKLKVTFEEDVVIMGAERGEGKFSDTLGSLVYGQYRNGVLTRRGTCSGMTDAEREHFWQNIDAYRGHVMVIRHMGQLQGGEGFRHPQFVRVRSGADSKAAQHCFWS